jgi:stearoyl-CoA desaturase (delta-9 desaturase)
MSPYKQTLYVVWGNHLLFILALIFFFQWWMIPVAFVMLHVFGMFSEVAMHRYWTHKSYTTARWKEHILKAWAFLAGQGATLSWVTVHRYHHAYEDTPMDPHSPLHMPWWKIYIGLFPDKYKKALIKDLIRHPDKDYFIFENKHYWQMWTALWVTSLLIHPVMFFLIVSGAAMWYWATSIVNILSHGFILGKPRDSDYVATNSVILNILTGIGHHNNHHIYPNSYTYSVDGEIDLNGLVIEKFFKQ